MTFFTAGPIIDLAASVGVDRDTLVTAEGPGRLHYNAAATGAQAAGMSKSALDAAADQYGNALRLSVKLGSYEEFGYADGYDPDRFANLASLEPDSSYDLTIIVKTADIAKRFATETVNASCFLFEDTVTGLLSSKASDAQQLLWPKLDARAVVLVGDRDTRVDGPALTIRGTSTNDPAQLCVPAELDHELLTRARRRRPDHVVWDSTVATSLTPWHAIRTAEAADAPLFAAVDGLFTDLAVLYICDRVLVADDGVITAEFRGGDHTARVRVGGPRQMNDPGLRSLQAVTDVLAWAYGPEHVEGQIDWTAERLPFVQAQIARILVAVPDQDRQAAFVTEMPAVESAVTWQWRTFVEGRVSRYIDKVQAVENAVDEAVNAYTAAVSALVADLNKAVLAAVGTVVGTFVAAALRDPFNADLFRVGVWVYAGYVLVFPGMIGLLATWQRADEIGSTFTGRRRNLADVLPAGKINGIVGSRTMTARSRLKGWLAVAAVIYVVLFAGSLLAAWKIPEIVAPG